VAGLLLFGPFHFFIFYLMNGFNFFINGARATRRVALYAGFFLLITGLLIFAYPRIFAFLVAGLFCLLGIVLLIAASLMKQPSSSQSSSDTEDGDYEELP